MFEIVGEKQHFTQYELNQLVVNPCMKVNDKVVFRNSCGKTSVTYAREQDGNVVADVPNILLQYPLNILVNLRQDNELHIDCETVFSVMEAEKPEDYKFVDNIIPKPAQTVVASVLGSDGKLKNSVLPDGYPYSYSEEIELLPEHSIDTEGYYQVVTARVPIVIGQMCTVVWDGEEYECTAWEEPEYKQLMIGNGSFVSLGSREDVPFLFQVYNPEGWENTGWAVWSDAGHHVFSIPKAIINNVVQLDKKYVPIDTTGYQRISFTESNYASPDAIPSDLWLRVEATNKTGDLLCVNVETGELCLSHFYMGAPIRVVDEWLDLSTFTEQTFTYTLRNSDIDDYDLRYRPLLMQIADMGLEKLYVVDIGYAKIQTGPIKMSSEKVVVMNGDYYYVTVNSDKFANDGTLTITLKKLGSVI